MDVTAEVREKVASHLRWALLLADCTIDEATCSDEDWELQKCFRTLMKSCKVCTADSTIVKHITWPHELVYIVGGQPAVYEEQSLPLFVSVFNHIGHS